MKYAKITLFVAACTALTTVLSPVAALAEFDTPYVSLGADLSGSETDEILALFGVDRDMINEDTSVLVTNEDECRYLTGAMDGGAVGTGAFSSCKVVRREKGYGIRVTTHNVTDVNEAMYANALATAGVVDADIVVASPVPVSGTTALVGAMAAYSKMNGLALDPEVIAEAAGELDLARLIGELTGDPDKAAQLIAAVKEVVLNNDLRTEEDIRDAIDEIAGQLELEITEEQKDRLIGVMKGIKALNLDPKVLGEQLSDLYEKAKENGLDLSEFGISDDEAGSLIGKAAEALENLFSNL